MNGWLVLFLLGVILGCGRKPFRQAVVENPQARKNIVFRSFEDLSSPRFLELKEKYHIDTVFGDELDEFRRILLLRNWIREIMSIDNSGEGYPGKGEAEAIIDAALEGQGFHCGHFMIVQNAILNAYGYVTRCIAAGEGENDALEGHHGVNEVWINSLNKWVMVDAKYNNHFEKNGVPLSALEIRDEWLRNRGADIVLAKGPDRKVITFDPEVNNRTKEQFARIYTWLEWETYNDRYTAWPEVKSHINLYEDGYFKDHVWLWGGKPHWAYGTKYMILVKDRGAIEWTPNTLSSEVTIVKSKARILLDTATTPNLRTCQMRKGGTCKWNDIDASIQVTLRPGRNQFEFRTVNVANVPGPVHKIVIEN